MTQTMLLIDGPSVLYAVSSLPAAPKISPRSGSYKSQPLGPSYLYTRTFLSLLKRFTPCHSVTFWDGGLSPQRLALYPQYKGGPHEPEPIYYFNQRFLHTRVLPALNVPSFQFPHTECDDLLAYSALHLIRTLTLNTHVIIVSSDGDFSQLLRHSNISRYNFRTKELVTECPLTSRAIFKALVGDASDSIPGVGRVGHTTAKKLLQNPLRLRSNLTPQQLQNLRRNHRLISLHYASRHLPPAIRTTLDITLEEARSVPPLTSNALPKAAHILFSELEWNSLLT